ncbi:MAG TPA: hypothetical protein VGU73_00325 [Acidimicrobiia bacterium]|nr:hypothetical protein [Acidimicrobiia bacterium]
MRWSPPLARSLSAVAITAAVSVAVPSLGSPARIAPVAVRAVLVGGSPDRVAVGPTGVWVGDLGHLSRVDAATDRVVHVTGATTPIAVAADQVWSGVFDEPDAVARLDPTTTQVMARIQLGGAPAAIAIGFGAVWVLDSSAVLTRIDPTTDSVTTRVPLGGMEPAVAPGEEIGAVGFGVAAGPDAVWATGRSIDNHQSLLWRVDPTTDAVLAAPLPVDCAALAGGPAGVWGSCGTAQRIETGSTLSDKGVDALDGVAVNGTSAWALGRSALVTRLDAGTGAVLATYSAPAGAEGIAVGANAIWLAAPHLHEPSESGIGTLLRLAVPGIGP